MEKTFRDVMNYEQLGEYLQVSREAIDQFVEEGLPFFTINKENPKSHKRFLKTKVDEWLEKRSVSLSSDN